MIGLNVAVIDAEIVGKNKHRFPNLACMKISAHNKKIGNTVSLVTDYRLLFSTYIEKDFEEEIEEEYLMSDKIKKGGKFKIRYYREKDLIYDKIFVSKVFENTTYPAFIINLDICEYGGTGFFYDKAPPLPEEIEHIMPDYSLYDEWVDNCIQAGANKNEFTIYKNYSIGFLTKGCFRKCTFCVNRNSERSALHSPLDEFVDMKRNKICLLDDNFLACKDWRAVLSELKSLKKPFQFKQGLDERLLSTETIVALTKDVKYDEQYYFAFDNIRDKDIIIEKLKLWVLHKKNNKKTTFYVLCGYDETGKYDSEFWVNDIINLFERIKILIEYGVYPYIMRYKMWEESPFRGTYINVSLWCNQSFVFSKMSYLEACVADDKRKSSNNSSATWRYLKELEQSYPLIAQKYYGLKSKQ